MVAIFTGNGLGLFNASVGAGSTRVGQGRDSFSINAATGNLVLQGYDESLLVRGLNAAAVRTYNSRGQLSDSGQDGWVTGYERRILLDGAVGAVDSTVTLFMGDGERRTFKFNSGTTYTSTDGEGAHDTITWNAATSTWGYVEGSSRREETYANHADTTQRGRLQQIRDLRSDRTTPAQFDVLYDRLGRVSEVRSVDGSAAGDAIIYAYVGTTQQLDSISTREGGVLKGQVSYGYDTYGRLAWVQTDLTPNNAADNEWVTGAGGSNDHRLFRTSYDYVTASASDLRIARVTGSDGVTAAYTYEADGAGGFRVKTVTQGSASDASARTLTFTYGSGATDVSDNAGRTWTYQYDPNKRLSAMLEPAVDGMRTRTAYQHDIAGNITRISGNAMAGATPGAALVDTVFRYDANGNRLLQRDRGGNTTVWTYNARNQVLTETRYTVADADGLDPTHVGTVNLPSGALTTQYIYDARDRLRFIVNANGEVRELSYASGGNGIGALASERRYFGATYSGAYTEFALILWTANAAAKRRAESSLTTYTYDAKGRLQETIEYADVSADAAGNGFLNGRATVTRYTYDAQGLLRQKIIVRGLRTDSTTLAGSEVTEYVYDGMGRLLSMLSRDASSAADDDVHTIQTTYVYTDSRNWINVVSDTGLRRVEARNSSGDVQATWGVGALNQAGNNANVVIGTRNDYDEAGRLRATTDAAGGRMYYFYDNAGRVTGTVDATGAVIRTIYDALGRKSYTVAFSWRVDTSTWLVGDTVIKTELDFGDEPSAGSHLAHVQWSDYDRQTSSYTYDDAGRLATMRDAAGLVTRYQYDGASRLISTTQNGYGTNPAGQRVTRFFYDNADRLIGTLDAEGYLAESIFDAGGRLVKTIRYATLTDSAYQASGTLAQLRPLTSGGDQSTRYFYDARGRQIGMLDAEGYLTESLYDEAGNQRAVKEYANKIRKLSGNETLAYLRDIATQGESPDTVRLTRSLYNGLGQLTLSQNHEGTVTRYTYDEAGRLVKTEAAQGTSEVREGHRRYDAFGHLIGELSGEDAEHLLPGMSEAELDAVYAQYGVRHSYDLLSRRIESTDSLGNKTWYFYDANSRQTFTVRGVEDSADIRNAQGEVSETRYNAFGEVTDTIAYTGRITIEIPGDRTSVQSAISTLQYVAAQDSRTEFGYDLWGRLEYQYEADGQQRGYSYSAFGDLTYSTRIYRDAQNRTQYARNQYTYDRRGLRLSQTDTAGSLTRSVTNTYDAFGRVTRQIDARGTTRDLAYDRLGRQVSTTTSGVSGQDLVQHSSYDAFDRMLTQTDATGRTTSYVYSDSARSVTVTSPEGVSITTLQNRFGQTVEVRQPQPGGTTAITRSVYDHDGNLTLQTDPLGNIARNAYDVRGLLATSIDASGRQVAYSYDAVGRMLTRVEDPRTGRLDHGKLNLVTSYTFDGQGRTVQVTDASGRVVAMSYDRKGQLIEQRVDPDGLNLRTTYTRDPDGRELSMVEGAGTAAARQTVYVYDGFGRRIRETVGTGSAQVVTNYEYDANNNVVRKTGAGGTVQFAYDAANRLRFTVDATGGLTEQVYDAAGRVTAQRSYAKAVNLSSLGTAIPTEAQLVGFVTSQSLRNDSQDQASYQVYDGDGRARLSISGAGGVIESIYDSAGRRIAEKRYANTLPLTAALRDSIAAGTASIASLLAMTGSHAGIDSVMRYFYDANDRLVYIVDGTGGMTRMWYDAAGRVVSTRQFAKPAAVATLETATIASLDAQLDWAPGFEGESRVYDGAGRLRFKLGTDGYLIETRYDAAGNVVGNLRYFASAVELQYAHDTPLYLGTVQISDFDDFVAANEATAASSHSVYDAAGRQQLTITRTSSTQAAVVEQQYDQAGRMVGSYAYTALLNVDDTLSYELSQDFVTEASLSTWLSANRATAQIQRMVYDAAGRVAYSINGAGAVTSTTYNALGMVASVRQHAQAVALNLNGTTLDAAQVAAALVSTAQDRVDYSIYDAAARAVFRVHADGSVEEMRYDGIGRVRTTLAYTAKLDAATMAQVAAGTANQASFAAHVTANEAGARAEGMFYDQAGRVIYQVLRSGPGRGQVTQTGYDGIGREIRKTRVGYDIPYALGATVSDILSALSVGLSTDGAVRATQTRTVRYFYDAGNRQRFVLDPSGVLTEQRFDAIGRVTQTIGYGTRPSSATAALATWVAAQPASAYRAVTQVYDYAGQVTSRTDALGQVEYFQYDAAGNITYHTDRAGAVWAYEYDRAGRRTAEISPAVAVSTAAGSVTTRSIITRMEYNGVSSMTRRVENADTTQSRVTRYDYDNRGHTIRITLPDPVTGLDPATGVADTIEIAYDTFGQAALEKDALGNYSYKVYDNRGRVIYDIDQELHVTSHVYNAFGEEIRSVRHAETLYTGDIPPYAGEGSEDWVADQVQSQVKIEKRLFPSTYDRGVDSIYDVLGRKVQVQQDTVSYVKSDGTVANGRPTLRSQFNAYGEAVKTSILLEGTPDTAGAVWADTYKYYDVLGRETVSVDAEGYVNSQTYSVYGEIQTKIEHARKLASTVLSTLGTALPPSLPTAGDAVTGYDRRVDFAYDALGRVTTQTVQHWSQRSSASAATLIDVSTQFGYDAEGRTTSIIDSLGTTTNRYDALGRMISVQQPSRAVLVAQADTQLGVSIYNTLNSTALYEQRSPYTELSYDAFGNAVRVQRYADGKNGTNAAVAGSNDQVTETDYDRRGRVVAERDLAAGTVSTRTYDADNRVVSMQTRTTDYRGYSFTTRYTYDNVGRQLSSATGSSSTSTEASEIVRYNAFGEVTGKDDRFSTAFDNTPYIVYKYDNAGRAVRNNAQGGAWTDQGYDLAGRMVRSQKSSFFFDHVGKTLKLVDAITNIRYDKLGRAIRHELPSNSDDLNQRPVITRDYDRWGNVVRNVDARGYETLIRYNSQNKAVEEIRPEVKVVNANGTEVRIRPMLNWYYDSYGRLTESRDANGNVQRMVYDNAGRLMQSTDALGNVTLMAYDVFDRERYTQNPLGYITWKAYDTAGRVSSHGDFLDVYRMSGTRRERKTLETYGLQGSTDRWSVTNALGHTASYNYDSRHLLTSSYSAAGVSKHYAHNLQGLKARESNGPYNYHRNLLSQKDVNGTIINWTTAGAPGPPTAYSGPDIYRDIEGEYVFVDEQTWDYDVFGRLIDHNDLGGADYNYDYHAQTGQLIRTARTASSRMDVISKLGGTPSFTEVVPPDSASLTSSLDFDRRLATGESMQFYYASGLVKGVRQRDNWTRYEYDANGNRTLEHTYAVDGNGNGIQLRTVTEYDSQNRISMVRQFDMGTHYEEATNGKEIFTVRYSYDAAGNRRSVIVERSGSGPQADVGTPVYGPLVILKDGPVSYWYEYDALNRVTLGRGVLKDGKIEFRKYSNDLLAYSPSYSVTYDEAGREIMYLGDLTARLTQYNQRSQRTGTQTLGGRQVELMQYDDAGRKTAHHYYADADRAHIYPTQTKSQKNFVYDNDGRVTSELTQGYTYGSRDVSGAWNIGAWVLLSESTFSYDYTREGRLQNNTYRAIADEYFIVGGPDWQTGWTVNYRYDYYAHESYLESRIFGSGPSQAGTTSSEYDAWGRRTTLNVGSEKRFFAYNGSSNIVQRIIGGSVSRYAYALGQQVATSTNFSSSSNVDYTFVDVTSGLTGYSNSESGSSSAVVQSGDTLRSIAARVYGNESLWYVLASANALDGSEALPAGTTLKVPEVKVNKSDANTFKPYNPGDIIGSTTPSLDYVAQPPQAACSKAGQIILAILVVVVVALVTVFTAGVLAAPAGAGAAAVFATGSAVLAGTAGIGFVATVGIAAVAGAVGAIAGQLVNTAFNSDAEFDWSAVARDALTTAATAGFGSLLSGGKKGFDTVQALKKSKTALTTANAGFFNANMWARGAAQAVGSNLVNYGANWAINRVDPSRDRSNEKFSWVNLAASTVSGGLAAQVGDWTKGVTGIGRLGVDTATNFGGSFLQHNVASLLGEEGRPDYGQMAIDAFGNALADAAKRGITNLEHSKVEADAEKDAMVEHVYEQNEERYSGDAGDEWDIASSEVMSFYAGSGRNRYGNDAEGEESIADYLKDVASLAADGANVLGDDPVEIQRQRNMMKKFLLKMSSFPGVDSFDITMARGALSAEGFVVSDAGFLSGFSAGDKVAANLFVVDPNLRETVKDWKVWAPGSKGYAHGDVVKSVQIALGFTGKDVDGIFGEGTKGALSTYLSKNISTSRPLDGSGSISIKIPATKKLDKVAHVVVATDSSLLGATSMLYESGKTDPLRASAVISNGKGDPGGVSYGAYQLSSSAGTLGKFLKSGEAANFSVYFSGVSWKDKAPFGSKWKLAAKEQGFKFFEAQHNFMDRTHYEPIVDAMNKRHGVDIRSMPMGVQNSIWSTAVQHGKAKMIINDAFKKTLGDVRADDPAFSKKLINNIYDRRSSYVKVLRDGKTDQSQINNFNNILEKRYPAERKTNLNLLSSPGSLSAPAVRTQQSSISLWPSVRWPAFLPFGHK